MFLITKISENLNQSAGSAIPNLSTEQIKDTNIPLPSLPEQKSIVTNLDQLSQQILILRTDYQVQLQQYDELWASTLDMAFRGELVKE